MVESTNTSNAEISQSPNSFQTEIGSTEQSAVDQVYDQILGRIVRGELVSGKILSSSRLAEELGVSRTPVVAAIDRLVSEGILSKALKRRAQVRESAETWLLQIHKLREIVEPPAAALAAIHITDEALQKLSELVDLAAPVGGIMSFEAVRALDSGVHLAIADHCHNLPLSETIYKCWKYKRIWYQLGECNNSEIEEIDYREHLEIVSALSRHDAITASAAMLFHLRSSLRFTKFAVKSSDFE